MNTPTADNHVVVLKNRQSLEVSGVRQVESFDEGKVVLETTLGLLQIRGRGLNINQLNVEQENLEVEGEITALEYNQDPSGRGIG